MDSEARSQNSLSIVCDSQFPLSLPLCPDSQGTNNTPVAIINIAYSNLIRFISLIITNTSALTPDTGVRFGRLDHQCLKNSETAEYLDLECWDLADGDVKSQESGGRLGHARPVHCPPPSLDTQGTYEVATLRFTNVSV